MSSAIRVVWLSNSPTVLSVVQASAQFDLAVLQSDRPTNRSLRWGSSQALLAGATVYGIGFPLGTTGSPVLTKGIVSRSGSSGGVDIVQTDAALNPGNSGGPLIDDCGLVIGVNTLKFGEGFSWAIASSSARPVVDSIARGERQPAPTALVFDGPEQAISHAWTSLGASSPYAGDCQREPPVGSWCSIQALSGSGLRLYSVGKAYSSVFVGVAVLADEPLGKVRLLGWDPAKILSASNYMVSGVGDCLNLRNSPGLDGGVAGCLADGTMVQTSGVVAWEDGYIWMALVDGRWLAARWLCLPIHCPLSNVPNQT